LVGLHALEEVEVEVVAGEVVGVVEVIRAVAVGAVAVAVVEPVVVAVAEEDEARV